MAEPDWDDRPGIEEQTLAFFARGMTNLWELIGEEKPAMIKVIICQVVLTCLSLMTPYCIKLIFDDLPNAVKAGAISQLILIAIGGMFAAKVIGLTLRQFGREVILKRSLIRLENLWPVRAQSKLLELSLGYHARENMGKKIAKVNKGCDKMVNIMCNIAWGLMPHSFYLVINVIVMLYLDLKLGLMFSIPFLLAVVGNIHVYRKFAPMWDEWEKKKEESHGIFCQSIINVSTVQSYVQEDKERRRLSSVREKMTELDTDICLRIDRYFWALGSLLHLSFVATIAFGIYFVFEGQSQTGTLVYLIATGNVTIQSVWEMTNIYTRIMRDLVAVNRMKDLLNTPVEIENDDNALIPSTTNGELTLKKVTFTYPGKDEPVLNDFSLRFKPGTMNALVGKSGEGKSTIIKLICRMYDINDGSIKLDADDIRQLNRNWFRGLFATVQQDVEIFDTTLQANIAYPCSDYTDEQVQEALEAAHLAEMVADAEKFPDGLQTKVGDRGVKLSGGEKQRVGIARAYLALLQGARFLILDEATSSLDSEAEQAIQEMIEDLRKRKSITIIAIAHRLSTIRQADVINVIQGGRVIEQGNHQALMEQGKTYSRLVELQQLEPVNV